MQLNNSIYYQEHNPELLQYLAQSEFNRLIDPQYVANLSRPYIIRAVGYIRVSLPDQAKNDKVSLDEQKAEIKEFIERMVGNL